METEILANNVKTNILDTNNCDVKLTQFANIRDVDNWQYLLPLVGTDTTKTVSATLLVCQH